MPRPVFRSASPARKKDDGFYHLTGHWMGRPMPLYHGQHVGVAIALELDAGEAPRPVTIEIACLREDGSKQANGSTVTFSPGQGAVYDFALTFTDPPRLERRQIILSEQGNPENRAALWVEVYSAEQGAFGRPGAAAPADETLIAAFAQQLPLPLCDDHLAYLRRVNGQSYVWWQAPDWSRATAFYTALADYEEAHEEKLGLMRDIHTIFGFRSGHPHIGYPEDPGAFNFFAPEYLAHVVPVGVDAGGNLIVQALSGARRGKVYFLDHEYHFGMVEEVKEAIRSQRDGAFWEIMEPEALLPLAESFEAMIGLLDQHHSAMMEALRRFRLT
ncbi:hypothetical protein N4R57_13220 [Rhodobacteraceae bacterium D3-12]|nr:hypothetical protein N4R57_13220 [Rhodobacteraceae bacterium D3-12]